MFGINADIIFSKQNKEATHDHSPFTLLAKAKICTKTNNSFLFSIGKGQGEILLSMP